MPNLQLRVLHRYCGVFFAPALLFFCTTGLLQTFDLHKPKAGAQPPRLVLELAALHKNQTLAVAAKPAPRVGGDKAGRAGAPRRQPSLGEQLMKLFVAATSVTLGLTTLAGVQMALRPARGRGLVWGVLALGVAIPVGLLLLM